MQSFMLNKSCSYSNNNNSLETKACKLMQHMQEYQEEQNSGYFRKYYIISLNRILFLTG